ncbi:ATP-dependent DNA helicase UvrD2 [Gordonia hydrophobica]|uniref:DNA 3'-5' helicase n=1 Tax=Gordonia hydrophobica TaxID=40516 RepID=A0ABZ2TX43_9ACTN|nr:ATP-dependent DNA helicase UvrD2 [Gordonia hydrophobica]MBM7366224.1 DNA helicase-2/ATP-dependent DNA helicase PcrA [Gordonia hydrophobica]
MTTAERTRTEGGATAGLDPEQLQAVLAPRGPVCVLAGAGTGKTRTITRRIAHLVDSGQVNPSQVLAVTFTARAAAEMRERLAALGVSGPGNSVAAQTFHAAALRQLRYFWPMAFGDVRWELLEHKFRMVARVARKVGVDAADRDLLRDLASEIEWAKSSAIGPDQYADAAARAHRDVPTDPRTVTQVFAAYEAAKVAPNGDRLLDFEDLLIYTTMILQSDPSIAEEFRSRYRSFVVDEYQDVTPIQQNLLDAWLGGRDDLTVVGDANQTIYSFTGATPSYLLDFTRRFPDATLVRLQRDYRSTPQVVHLANAAIGKARGRIAGTRLQLVGQREAGPEPVFAGYDDEISEVVGVVAQIRKRIRAGVPASEIAVLYRVNAQSEAYEEALSEAGIDYQVRGAQTFFERPEIVASMRRLTSLAGGPPPPMPPVDAVRHALHQVGLTESEPKGANARARWQQLLRLVEIVESIAAEDPGLDFAGVVGKLEERSKMRHAPIGAGVTLSSMHAAKGLEWDAVFLTGLHEGSMPLGRASKTTDDVEEERRLFYVGITRAREHLHLSWSLARGEGRGAKRRRSRFLEALVPATPSGMDFEPLPERTEPDPDVLVALTAWRKAFADEHEIMESNVMSKTMVRTIATAVPTTLADLAKVRGFGQARTDEFGAAIIAVVDAALPGKS